MRDPVTEHDFHPRPMERCRYKIFNHLVELIQEDVGAWCLFERARIPWRFQTCSRRHGLGTDRCTGALTTHPRARSIRETFDVWPKQLCSSLPGRRLKPAL